MNTFFDEEKILLDDFLTRSIFKPSYTFEEVTRAIDRGTMADSLDFHGVELIIRPECNQKCEYCYIARYGHDLFPVEERGTKEQLLHNIDLILEQEIVR